MKNILKVLLTFLMVIFNLISNAQIIDNYGIRFGLGISNQYWKINNDQLSDLSDWKENKVGLTVYLNCEKKLSDFISLRPEIGYIQKGFKDDITLIIPEEEDIKPENNKVILHDLSFNLGVKIIPIHGKFKPYFLVGLRVDYLLGYKDIEFEIQNKTYGLYEEFLSDYKKIVLSGLIGIGLDYNDLIYLDLEFNPALSKNLDKGILSIKDRYLGISIGFNINNILK